MFLSKCRRYNATVTPHVQFLNSGLVVVLFCCPKYYNTEKKELYNLKMLFKLWGNRKEEFRDDKARVLHLQSQILSSLGSLEY